MAVDEQYFPVWLWYPSGAEVSRIQVYENGDDLHSYPQPGRQGRQEPLGRPVDEIPSVVIQKHMYIVSET